MPGSVITDEGNQVVEKLIPGIQGTDATNGRGITHLNIGLQK